MSGMESSRYYGLIRIVDKDVRYSFCCPENLQLMGKCMEHLFFLGGNKNPPNFLRVESGERFVGLGNLGAWHFFCVFLGGGVGDDEIH